MTQAGFKMEMRLNRGRLSSENINTALDYIFTDGTAEFAGYMLRTKKLGIENAANIISKMNGAEQNQLIRWLDGRPANLPTHAIEMKVINIIASR